MKLITNILRHEEIYQSFVFDRLIQCIGAWKYGYIAGDLQLMSFDRHHLQRRIVIIYMLRSSGFPEDETFFKVLQLSKFFRSF